MFVITWRELDDVALAIVMVLLLPFLVMAVICWVVYVFISEYVKYFTGKPLWNEQHPTLDDTPL